ncbi:protein FAR1-RELATED SEQUENCE 6-like [Camellia sinensis]|uniref:protein FAR1-RELATED SEQUENCE 6-like n=1 Tax=Camellia sinensis TaxID=4442 RepID=UPI00103661A4|nr:protein FAR1-RELATED SEQUENCE 6-like [Camellia sinensis]
MEIDSNVGDNPSINEGEEVEEPKKSVCFSSREEMYTFYGKYAKHVGFSIAHRAQHFGDDGQLKNFAIECSREGKRKKKSEVNPLKPSLSTKIGCKARRKLEINDQARIGVSSNFHSMVVEAGGYESLTFDERDARNYIERARKLRLGEGDVESLQNYFMKMQTHSERFFYIIDVNEEFHIRNVFWADARSWVTYEAFGDIVSFDTTYLTNKYDMPFALFIGVNYHGQSILLGCGLLPSESNDTFKIPEKLKGYAQYEAIKLAMQNAVYDCLTRVEFENK